MYKKLLPLKVYNWVSFERHIYPWIPCQNQNTNSSSTHKVLPMPLCSPSFPLLLTPSQKWSHFQHNRWVLFSKSYINGIVFYVLFMSGYFTQHNEFETHPYSISSLFLSFWILAVFNCGIHHSLFVSIIGHLAVYSLGLLWTKLLTAIVYESFSEICPFFGYKYLRKEWLVW